MIRMSMLAKGAALLMAAFLMTTALRAAEPEKAAFTKTPIPADYPLDTCVVTDEKLNDDEPAVAYVHEGRTIVFCCPKCVDIFKKEPAKYLAKLDAAAAAKKAAATPAPPEVAPPEAAPPEPAPPMETPPKEE